MRSKLFLAGILFFFGAILRAQTTTSGLFEQALKKFNQGDYAGALSCDIKALEIAQKENNCLMEAYATHQVARMHYYLRDRRLALSWMFKANQLAENCEVDSVIQRTLHNIGSIYQELNRPDSSMLFYSRAKILLDKSQNWPELSTLYGVMGELCHRALKRDKDAATYIDLCEKYARLAQDTNKLAFSFMKRGNLAVHFRDFKKAEDYFTIARNLYRHIGQVEGEMYALSLLGVSKSMQGDTTIYLVYGALSKMRDSIFKATTAEKVAEYKTLYETEKAQTENRELAKTNQQKSILLMVTLLGTLGLLTILWFAYSRYRIKKENEFEKQKSQHKTLRYKEVLEAEEKERIRIARELHDGIGQLLSATRMNVSVIKTGDAYDAGQLKTSITLLDKAVTEIRTISHNLMPSSLVDRGLSAALREMAGHVNSTNTFKLELVILNDLELPSVSEVSIFRLIQEIVNNAIRHSQATQVNLTLGNEENNCFAEIRDNGIGFDTSKISESKGIGWKNIFSRVELLNGTIEINSQPGKGTTVLIEFKK